MSEGQAFVEISQWQRKVGQEAADYARENFLPVYAGRKCVDGRYEAGQYSGAIARPGGDFGYVMALLAVNRDRNLGLTPEQCFAAVYDAVTQGDGRFSMHTDTHNEHDAKSIGCGHIARALDERNSSLFGLNPQDVRAATNYAKQRFANHDERLDMTILSGGHEEAGVLVVTGTKNTINPYSHFGRRMYFIYDEARDEEFMRELVRKMGIQGLSLEDFREASQRQTTATLRLLAGNKPMVRINADIPERPEVDYGSITIIPPIS